MRQQKLASIFQLVFFFVMTSAASATLTYQVSDGISTFTIADSGSGDLSSQVGAVAYTNSFGNVSLNVGTAISRPMIGSTALPQQHLDSVIVSTGAVNLTIALSDTNFSGSGNAHFLASIAGIINAAPGSTATYSVYRDLSNNLFGTGPGTLVCTTGPLSIGAVPFNFGGSCAAAPTINNAYSLTSVANINLFGPGNSSFDAVLVDAPEPASILLLGMGLIGLAAAWRRNASQDLNQGVAHASGLLAFFRRFYF